MGDAMIYAHVTNGTPDQFGRPPALFVADGLWRDHRASGPIDTELALIDWYPVAESDRPAATGRATHDRSYSFDGQTVTVTWTERPWTADETEARRLAANHAAIAQAIDAAITQLDTLIAAPAVDTVPAGTLTAAQLSNIARAMRDAVQANRAGAQQVALILKRTIKLVRGDYDTVS